MAWALLVLAVGVCVLLIFWNPALHPGPACPSRAWLNLECPGCGSTRALHQLLHLNPRQALRYNPAMVIFGLPVVALFAADIFSTIKRHRRITVALKPWLGVTLAVFLLLYMLARNLPYDSLAFLQPPV